jgi:hypothetical protein
MRASSLLLLSLTVVFTAACGGSRTPASSPEVPSGTMTLRTTDNTVEQATVIGDRFFGPDVEIAREGDNYRGRAFGQLLDLEWRGSTLQGIAGSDRTELHLKEHEDGFDMRGLYAGKLGGLEVRKDRIAGRMGRCEYDLRSEPKAGGYRGSRSCKGMPVQADLEVAPFVAALPPRERAAWMVTFLGR